MNSSTLRQYIITGYINTITFYSPRQKYMFFFFSFLASYFFPFSFLNNCRYASPRETDWITALSSGESELTSHLHPTLKRPRGQRCGIVNGERLHELLTVLMFPLSLPSYRYSTLSVPMGLWANFSHFAVLFFFPPTVKPSFSKKKKETKKNKQDD